MSSGGALTIFASVSWADASASSRPPLPPTRPPSSSEIQRGSGTTPASPPSVVAPLAPPGAGAPETQSVWPTALRSICPTVQISFPRSILAATLVALQSGSRAAIRTRMRRASQSIFRQSPSPMGDVSRSATTRIPRKSCSCVQCAKSPAVGLPLGPGADAAHAEHFHFDTPRHGASDRYRICE